MNRDRQLGIGCLAVLLVLLAVGAGARRFFGRDEGPQPRIQDRARVGAEPMDGERHQVPPVPRVRDHEVTPPPTADAAILEVQCDAVDGFGPTEGTVVKVAGTSDTNPGFALGRGRIIEGQVVTEVKGKVGGELFRITAPGFRPTRTSWRMGPTGPTCSPIQWVVAPRISGRVTNAFLPDTQTEVQLCDRRVELEQDGTFSADFPGTVPCEVVAVRWDGILEVRSTPILVDPDAPSEGLSLELPPRRVAGVGMALIVDDRGVVVGGVIADGPADRGGIGEGMVIEAVDGLPLHDLEEAIDAITGDEYTGVDLSVRDERGVSTRVHLIRQFDASID